MSWSVGFWHIASSELPLMSAVICDLAADLGGVTRLTKARLGCVSWLRRSISSCDKC